MFSLTPCGRVQTPSQKVLSVAFSLDGNLCAAADRDGFIHVIDVAGGSIVRKFKQQHVEFIYTLAVHPQTGHLFSAGKDKSIREWDWESGSFIRDYAEIFAPGGMKSAPSKSLKPTTKSHKMTILSIALDGELMATASQDTMVKLWKNGEPVRTFDWHSGPVTCARFQPGSRVLFSASRDKTIRSWDDVTGALIHKYTGHLGEIIALEFIDAEQFVSVDVYGKVLKWHVSSESFDEIIYESQDRVICAHLVQNTSCLLLGCENGNIEVIDLKREVPTLSVHEHSSEIRSIQSNASGIIASSDNSGKVTLWNFSDVRGES